MNLPRLIFKLTEKVMESRLEDLAWRQAVRTRGPGGRDTEAGGGDPGAGGGDPGGRQWGPGDKWWGEER